MAQRKGPRRRKVGYVSVLAYVAGLKEAYALLRRARLHQIALGKRAETMPIRKRTPMPWPAGMEQWTEHAANVLHDLCLRMQEKIKEASK